MISRLQTNDKKKVMVSFFNTKNIGGPNTAMHKLVNSFLSQKYEFIPIIINEHLGKILKIKVLLRLIKTIKKEKPDVIYFTGMQLHGFYIALAAVLAGYKNKTIMAVRGSSCDALNLDRIQKFLFRYFIEPYTVKMTEIIHTVCTDMAHNPIVYKNCKNFGGVIYNSVPVKIEFNRSVFRSEISAANDELLMVFTGRLVEDKGISYLIEAIPSIDKRCRMIFVGDGNIGKYKAMCEQLGVVDRVIFLGKRKDIASILSGCDLFIFPTLHENLSNSLLEACTYGLPVVATNVGGNPEVIRNEIDGLLVPSADSIALANAINRIAQNNQLRKKMSQMAMEHMKEEFSPEKIFGKIDEIFTQIINNGN